MVSRANPSYAHRDIELLSLWGYTPYNPITEAVKLQLVVNCGVSVFVYKLCMDNVVTHRIHGEANGFPALTVLLFLFYWRMS